MRAQGAAMGAVRMESESWSRSCLVGCASALALAASASGAVVYQNTHNNGTFTPFSVVTAPGTRYGDGGWLGPPPGGGAYTLTGLTLRMAVYNSATPGTTDLTITINDGDPSGQLQGTGAVLHTTGVTGVALPATPPLQAVAFEVFVPLGSVSTLGGLNSIGFSVGVSNFSYDGQFGFALSTTSGQVAGNATPRASRFVGGAWTTFQFNDDPETGVANYVARFDGDAGGSACVADFDDGTGTGTQDGGVDIADLLYYLLLFDTGNIVADIDDGSGTNTPDQGVDISDLLYFLFRFELGC